MKHGYRLELWNMAVVGVYNEHKKGIMLLENTRSLKYCGRKHTQKSRMGGVKLERRRTKKGKLQKLKMIIKKKTTTTKKQKKKKKKQKSKII